MNKIDQIKKIKDKASIWLKGVFLGVIMLFMVGCAEKKLEVTTIETPKPKLNIQEPAKVNLQNVNFIIITDKNAEQVFKELKATGQKPVLIGLTTKDYEKMSYNLLELKQYILKQRNNIKSYRSYYESK